MLSVGDIRNRIMALADKSVKGNPEVYDLFAYRFPKDVDNGDLQLELNNMISGKNGKVKAIPNPMRNIIQSHLRYFNKKKSDDFDLRGASIGNLILTGGYLNNQRDIDSVIFIFSKLVEARATVRPITTRYLHIVAELENGKKVHGQHLITGKDSPPISSKIGNIYLSETIDGKKSASISIKPKIEHQIKKADLICYPMGSFYSSLISNLMVDGVGSTISRNPCPKVYIPNTFKDPEQFGMTVEDCVNSILETLKEGLDPEVDDTDLLNFVILDRFNQDYPDLGDISKIEEKGIKIIYTPLISERSQPMVDEERMAEVLISLI
jgi:CofD-related protein of GAK system